MGRSSQVPIPEGIVAFFRDHDEGAAGARWLAELPETVASLLEQWRLTLDGAPFPGSQLGWVGPMRTEDGAAAVLKVAYPHADGAHEAEALRAFDGRGAVRLLADADDGWVMLLERCVPGTPVHDLPISEGIRAAATVLARLWRPVPRPAPFRSLTDVALRWSAGLPRVVEGEGYDHQTVLAGMAAARELALSQPPRMLLHGDLNPFNILAAEREPWLAIDCKPVIGDPAYDTAQYLGNLAEPVLASDDPVATMRGFVEDFAGPLAQDPRRVAGWAFVKSLGWTWSPDMVEVFHRVWAATSQ
jgi:streptomycin 6-kinase